MSESYVKVLTKNDAGETGAHQAGITIPRKNQKLLKFFPSLDYNQFNPEAWIICEDPDGETWKLRYVYYNGKIFNPPKSTRNEYRITYLTKFLSKWSASEGDSLIFTASSKKNFYKMALRKEEVKSCGSKKAPGVVVLRGWSKVY